MAAAKITRLITDTQLHDLMKQVRGADPLEEFSEAARQELRALTI